MKPRRLRWAVQTARMGEIRNTYRILFRKSVEERSLEQPRMLWEGNITIVLREVVRITDR